jgi:hypothetical protein
MSFLQRAWNLTPIPNDGKAFYEFEPLLIERGEEVKLGSIIAGLSEPPQKLELMREFMNCELRSQKSRQQA